MAMNLKSLCAEAHDEHSVSQAEASMASLHSSLKDTIELFRVLISSSDT